MRLKFSYETEIRFSGPVEEHHYALMCLPRETASQQVLSWTLSVEPESRRITGPDPGKSGETETDFFGNSRIRGCLKEPHSFFRVKLQGAVRTGLALYDEYQTEDLVIYTVPSRYTAAGPRLRALCRDVQQALRQTCCAGAEEEIPPYDAALHVMHLVYSRMTYRPGVTAVRTTAEEALAGGMGVCQDYAHIMIALLRLLGIPARYAAGMMEGEGESHGWAEVNCRGYWYGFDPANNLLVNDRYIKISHGRDAGDCRISRGVFRNPTVQEQSVRVFVSPQNLQEQ
ncbi:MAG: transglutaminase domain-containing protein [Anaerovoracaceae bacterium]